MKRFVDAFLFCTETEDNMEDFEKWGKKVMADAQAAYDRGHDATARRILFEAKEKIEKEKAADEQKKVLDDFMTRYRKERYGEKPNYDNRYGNKNKK